MGFKVWELGLRLQGLGLGSRLEALRCGMEGSWFRV